MRLNLVLLLMVHRWLSLIWLILNLIIHRLSGRCEQSCSIYRLRGTDLWRGQLTLLIRCLLRALYSVWTLLSLLRMVGIWVIVAVRWLWLCAGSFWIIFRLIISCRILGNVAFGQLLTLINFSSHYFSGSTFGKQFLSVI